MNREEHLAWCKQRAMDYWNNGELGNAVASMLSDLNKHDETRHAGETLALVAMLYVSQHDREGVRRWIEGFR